MSKDNGGPAFPSNPSKDVFANIGMTLRDYFAAKALSGSDVMQHIASTPHDIETSVAVLAETAYLLADAMLKERVK